MPNDKANIAVRPDIGVHRIGVHRAICVDSVGVQRSCAVGCSQRELMRAIASSTWSSVTPCSPLSAGPWRRSGRGRAGASPSWRQHGSTAARRA
eukprot:6192479-Pleurochrysis_carterae.AAC.5